jgi:hypothetical protein
MLFSSDMLFSLALTCFSSGLAWFCSGPALTWFASGPADFLGVEPDELPSAHARVDQQPPPELAGSLE